MEMYTNVLFSFAGKEILKNNEVFYPINIENEVYEVKIVGPVKDGEKEILGPADKAKVDKFIKEFAEKKYSISKIQLSENEEDIIYEKIEAMEKENKKKFTKKEQKKLMEKLEEDLIEEKRIKLSQNFEIDVLNGRIPVQANAVFLDKEKKFGLLQIPSQENYNSRNIHTVNGLIFEVSCYNKNTKKIMSFEEVDNVEEKDMVFYFKVCEKNEIKNIKDIFEINNYLLNKIQDNGLKVNEKYYDPELNNLLKIKGKQDLEIQVEIDKINKFIEFYKTNHKEGNKNELEKEVEDIKESYWKVFDFFTKEKFDLQNYELYTYIYLQPEKRKDFVNYIKKDLIKSNNSLSTLGNKDKKNYLDNIPKMPFKILMSLQVVYEENEEGEFALSSIYHYPPTKRTNTAQRIFAYSYSKEKGFIPNFKPFSANGYGRGFAISTKIQDFLKKL